MEGMRKMSALAAISVACQIIAIKSMRLLMQRDPSDRKATGVIELLETALQSLKDEYNKVTKEETMEDLNADSSHS